MVSEDGQQRRDFVQVKDVAGAAPAAAGHAINIGSGRSCAISQVAALLTRAMGRQDLAPEILQPTRSGDVRHCFGNIAKARTLPGFEPQHRLEDSLDELVEWASQQQARDRVGDARRELEKRGLVV